LEFLLIDFGDKIQRMNKIIIKIISSKSRIKGLIPKTLNETDKKYIKTIKLKL